MNHEAQNAVDMTKMQHFQTNFQSKIGLVCSLKDIF